MSWPRHAPGGEGQGRDHRALIVDERAADRADLNSLALAKERQGQGIGRQLVRAAAAGGILSCGLHRVERLMRAHGLKARQRRRGLPKDEGQRAVIAGNVLDLQLTADAPNQKWAADFTLSGRPRGGYTLQPSSTCSHAASSASR